MPLTPGDAVISNTGGETLSGYAGARYTVLKAELVAEYLSWGQTLPTDPALLVPILRGLADRAREGKLLLEYLMANGTAGGDPIV